MIVPKWYRMKHSLRVIELTNDNVEEVKGWIQSNTNYLFNKNNCKHHIHTYTYDPAHKEMVIPLGSLVVIDESNAIQIYLTDTFEKMFYEVGYRTEETVDVLGD